MFRTKSRSLVNYTGQAGDSLYYNSSSESNLSQYFATFDDPVYWIGRYNAGMLLRNKLLTLPYTDWGAEEIEWQSGGRDRYNPCRHRKVNRVNLPYALCYIRDGYPARVLLASYMRKAQPSYVQWALSSMVHPETDYQGVKARAWHSMQPRFEGEVSMLNFLFELKDFRDCAKFIFKKDNLGKIAKLRDMFNRLALATKTTKIRKGYYLYKPHIPDGDVAGYWLTYQLAIKPFLSDIGKIFLQMSLIVKEAQDKFMKDGEVYQTSHYSEEINRSESMAYGSGNNYYYKYGTQNFTKFTATLRYKYDYSNRNTFDAWMKYWGMNPSFTVFWNAIPFTFIADYVVRIGNSIRAMEHDPNVRIHDWTYGESLKTRYQAGYVTTGDTRFKVLVLDGSFITGNKADRILSGCEGSIYTRGVRTPYYGPATPRFNKPTGTQFLNVAALARCFL